MRVCVGVTQQKLTVQINFLHPSVVQSIDDRNDRDIRMCTRTTSSVQECCKAYGALVRIFCVLFLIATHTHMHNCIYVYRYVYIQLKLRSLKLSSTVLFAPGERSWSPICEHCIHNETKRASERTLYDGSELCLQRPSERSHTQHRDRIQTQKAKSIINII